MPFFFVSSSPFFFSVLHGSGVHMLKKDSKRRRTKAEIAEQEAAALAKENMIATKLAKLDVVENQLAQAQQEALENQDAATLLQDLLRAGVVRQESDHTFVAQN